jgi:rare lipoprotein A
MRNYSNPSNSKQIAAFPRKIMLLYSFLFLGTVVAFGQTQQGLGTYYADKYHGSKTASGEVYNKNDFTAAHRTLAFGTRVKVTRLDNGRVVFVKINDRGPFTEGRIIDLSRAAAEQIDMIRSGEVMVRIEVVPNEVGIEDVYGEDIPPKPVANPNRDLNALPLVDYNGRPLNSSGRVKELPERELTDYNDYEGDNESRDEVSATVNPDIAKYTPQLFQMVAFKQGAEGYGVQVGAFFNFYRLLEAMDELSRKGIQNSLVQSSSKDGNPMFRIIVGPYPSKAEADAAKKRLAKNKYKGITVSLADLY